MNTKWTDFFAGYGVSVDGNKAYGEIDGYEINANVNGFDTVAPFRLHITCFAAEEQKRVIGDILSSRKDRYFNYAFTRYGLSVGIGDFTMGKLLKRLPEVFEFLFSTLREQGALGKGVCPICGKPIEEEQIKKCDLDGFTITMDFGCATDLSAAIAADKKQFDSAPNNYLKGFLGAVIGGLAGAVCVIILYLIGFVSSLSAVVSVTLGCFLYKKFKGKPNKMMLLIVGATTVAFMVISVLAVYIVAAGIAADGMYTPIEAFNILMTDSEFALWFYADLAMVLLFSAIGLGAEIYAQYKRIKRKDHFNY